MNVLQVTNNYGVTVTISDELLAKLVGTKQYPNHQELTEEEIKEKLEQSIKKLLKGLDLVFERDFIVSSQLDLLNEGIQKAVTKVGRVQGSFEAYFGN